MTNPRRLLARAAAAAAALVLALAASGCGRAGEALREVRDAAAAIGEEARSGAGLAAKEGAAAAPAPARAADEAAPPATQAASLEGAQAQPRPAAADRKRVYSGFARLSVGSVAEARDAMTSLAEEQGGYVESVEAASVVIRVPAARFRDAFAGVLALGRALEKRVETYDVTEQYQDLSGRLDVARRTRGRLYALLERSQDVKERVHILQEIRRLSEEIERLTLTLDTISRQVAFSRITAQLESRLAEEQNARGVMPFPWIAGLDPVYASLGRLRARVRLDLGSGFAVFARERSYRAESPEGTRVRVGTTENRPRGDARFWQEALLAAFAPLYRTAEPVQLGPATGVMLTSKDREPFFYLVAVVPRGRRLHVVEVFYPGREAFDLRRPVVGKGLSGLEVR